MLALPVVAVSIADSEPAFESTSPRTDASTTRSGRRATSSRRSASTPGRCSLRSRRRRRRDSRSARVCIRGSPSRARISSTSVGPALARLKARAGLTTQGEITALPFPDRSFDLVCAFDILEHVEDDRQAFRELGRVARDGATVIFSVPLDPARWSAFDTLVGHVRRYESGRPAGDPGRALLRARAERGLRHAAPERLAPRLRRMGSDAETGTGDALVQHAPPAPRTAAAEAPRMRTGPDRRGEGGRAPPRLPAWRPARSRVGARDDEPGPRFSASRRRRDSARSRCMPRCAASRVWP